VSGDGQFALLEQAGESFPEGFQPVRRVFCVACVDLAGDLVDLLVQVFRRVRVEVSGAYLCWSIHPPAAAPKPAACSLRPPATNANSSRSSTYADGRPAVRSYTQPPRKPALTSGNTTTAEASQDTEASARIAEAVDRLRRRGIAVEATTRAGVTTYLVERPTYRVKIVIDPARWLGVEFLLLGHDRVVDLGYWVDSDLYNISLDKYRWFAAEIETDIVLLLDGLVQGKVFVDRTSPRPSMIVPSSDGPLLIRRRRFGATKDLYDGGVTSGPPPGFRTLAP
jgi:hypothetical protein